MMCDRKRGVTFDRLYPCDEIVRCVRPRGPETTHRSTWVYDRHVVNALCTARCLRVAIRLPDQLEVSLDLVLREVVSRVLVVIPADGPRRDGVKLVEEELQ
jgi:hypothetical protein